MIHSKTNPLISFAFCCYSCGFCDILEEQVELFFITCRHLKLYVFLVRW